MKCRIEDVRAQRLQGNKAEHDALMTIAQGLAADEAKEARGRGRGRAQGGRASKGRGKRKAAAESPEAEKKTEEDTGSFCQICFLMTIYTPD